jgi:NADP-dependent 3-hydroxy-3-methylglutaryl-CoA reductase
VIPEVDRRRHRRVKLEATSPSSLTLEMTIQGRPHAARVLDLSEHGLRVALDQAPDPAVRARATIDDATIVGPGPERSRLGGLTVKAVTNGSAPAVLTLVTEDGDSRARLWFTVDRLSSSGSGVEDSPPSPTAEPSGAPPALPRIPARGQYSERARLERLEWLRRETQSVLAPLQTTRLQPERLTGNIENMIGAVEVPVGLAGPLLFRGHEAQGVIYAPMATTEGTLVASATRGATAISRSGGVHTRVFSQRMMRVPMFVLTTLEGAFLFASWVRDHVRELREQTKLVSRHAELISVEPTLIGRQVHVYFLYETADAAGQNMTTACTWQACQWLMAQMKHLEPVRFESFIIESNMSGDKKVTFQSLTMGRGIRVVADCVLDGRVMEQVLKITPEQLLRAYAGIQAGAIHVGMVGFNIDVANTIAAIFTATGQDIACVHESGLGQLHLQPAPEGVYASLVLPSLIIGTVGGGTHLPAQHALLEMMGCAGARKVRRLAEIIAGYALSLDLSTMSAVATGEFASAHERLGRSRPVEWMTRDDLGARFFEDALREAEGDPTLTVRAVEPIDVSLGSSIVTELTARKVSKLVGLIPLRIAHDGAAGAGEADVIVKVKPLDEEVILMVNSLAAMCGPRVAMAHNKHRARTGFAGCHTRELAVYEQTDPRFTRHAPKVIRTYRDDAREAYVVVLERLRDPVLMDTADNPRGWSRRHIEVAVRGIAEVHAIWLGRERELLARPWIGQPPTAAAMEEMSELWDALAIHAAGEFPGLVGDRALDRLQGGVRTIGAWWPRLESMPRTLVHNDFNPRNIALREDADGLRLCAYDWELATCRVPQHDLAELLCFVLSPQVKKRNVDHLVEAHRRALEAASGTAIDRDAWREGYRLSLRDLAINRFGLYLMAHTFRHYGFMERVIRTLWRLIDLEEAA